VSAEAEKEEKNRMQNKAYRIQKTAREKIKTIKSSA
jgi:hypothetical protein